MEAQLEYVCTHCIHVFARLAPICMLSRCLLTKFLHRRSVRSLLRVRCWLGVFLRPAAQPPLFVSRIIPHPSLILLSLLPSPSLIPISLATYTHTGLYPLAELPTGIFHGQFFLQIWHILAPFTLSFCKIFEVWLPILNWDAFSESFGLQKRWQLLPLPLLRLCITSTGEGRGVRGRKESSAFFPSHPSLS